MLDLSLMDKKALAKVFDYSVLPKDSTEAAIKKGCAITKQYGFAAFCFSSPYYAPLVKQELAECPDIEVGAAIDFPWGMSTPSAKAFMTEEAIRLGGTTLDICMNVGALKDKRFDVIREEMSLFVKAAAGQASTKCIIETCFLSDEDIVNACQILAETGVQYAKTSSGQFEGPSLEQVLLMVETLKGTGVKVKVAGVKFPRPQNAYIFMLAGADRIGTRDAPAILDALDTMRALGIVPPLRMAV